jgi:hypothetical protein
MNLYQRVERKIAMDILDKIVAGFIERTFGSYVTTIIGVLSVAAYAINTFTGAVPPQYHDAVTLVSTFIAGLALILAKDSGQSTPLK